MTFEAIRQQYEDFVNLRDWRQYHSPRNLALALVGEVGEVAELFQWRTDADCDGGLGGFSPAQRDAVADELADVLSYLIRLSSSCGVDLPAAWLRKMHVNASKYPADLVRGSAAKYTELRTNARASKAADKKGKKRK